MDHTKKKIEKMGQIIHCGKCRGTDNMHIHIQGKQSDKVEKMAHGTQPDPQYNEDRPLYLTGCQGGL